MPKSSLSLVSLLLLGACAGDPPVGPAEGSTSTLAGAATASTTVVMDHLDSPRGLAWGPEGALYVAEAGTTSASDRCAAVARGANCYSGTGAVSRLWHGKQERIATALPSAYNAAVSDIIGPNHIGFNGRGNAQVTIGWGGAPAARAELGDLGGLFGTLIKVEPNGGWRVVSDVTAFETTNPAGGPLDSNPYGVLAEAGTRFVTDAGGNSLLQVGTNGDVSLVATFPAIAVPPGPFNPPFAQSDAVPTGVVRGPDGALYVSTLTGVPFQPGVASVYRVVPGQAPTVFAGGLTQVTDLSWGPDGSLYLVQYASAPFFGGPGSLVRIAPDGTRTTITAALSHPTGVLAGPDGAIYVSNNGDQAAVGEVLRIVP